MEPGWSGLVVNTSDVSISWRTVRVRQRMFPLLGNDDREASRDVDSEAAVTVTRTIDDWE